jgi:hypothetical protein
MHVGWILQGAATTVFGAVIAVLCRFARKSDRIASKSVRDQTRFRRATRLPPIDQERYLKGLKAGFAFGIAFGILVAAIGVATTIKGLG